MANFYADRVSLVYGGLPLDGLEVSAFTFDVDIGLEFVDTMSDDYSVAGYVRGNTKITGSFTLKIPAAGSVPDLMGIDPQSENISLIATIASTQFNPVQFQGTTWILGGVACQAVNSSFSGPGTVAEQNFTFKAIVKTVVPPVAS